ncbi:hypothetical protein [Acidovorax sp. Leaf78]|uniref:hypothetical protein n=1 Tax=Acidovorax sp. Leaf78 TaxID=1736237 RepID=UPI000700333C|nr:hypothetical protein [Acidovorax sp. Leaf78]KQO23470.1 hypothetical protein ASF16_04725 [Acidovorax sp. Leaf78]
MTPSHWILTADGTDQHINGLQLLVQNKAPRIEVIAHSLAQINRFTGHAARPYSVAEHSILVADILDAQGHNCHVQRLGLMHDAHECMTGDAASPVKWVLNLAWIMFENPLAKLVRQHYHLQTAHTAYRHLVKHADLTALATERRDLMPFKAARNLLWDVIDRPGREVPALEAVSLNTPVREAMTWKHHRDTFLQRYELLTAQCQQMPGATA